MRIPFREPNWTQAPPGTTHCVIYRGADFLNYWLRDLPSGKLERYDAMMGRWVPADPDTLQMQVKRSRNERHFCVVPHPDICLLPKAPPPKSFRARLFEILRRKY